MHIDCHILTLPGERADWREQMAADLDKAPVNQHWTAGIAGQFGTARAAGYALGNAEYVMFADPDDRLMPGVVDELANALERRPFAPFAWAGEQATDEELQPLGAPRIWRAGYDARLLRNSPTHVHGVVLYRRALVEPHLPLLAQCGNGADWLLALLVAQPQNTNRPQDWQPVHVPMAGRLWRQHQGSYHRQFAKADRERVATLSGVQPQYLHSQPKPRAAGPVPCISCGPGR